MILIVTHKDDYTVDFVIDKMNHRSIPYYRFNCENCLHENFSISFGMPNTPFEDAVSRFTSVWYRRLRLPDVISQKLEERLFLLKEVESYLTNLLGIIEAKWMSDPYSLQKAENKFYQLKVAEKIGFPIPSTIVSNNKDHITSFHKQYGRIIVKPIARSRIDYADNTAKLIFTNIVPEDLILRLEQYEIQPVIFQHYIEKDYELRVTVVNNEVFAAKVDSQSHQESSIDWRKKRIPFEATHLPEDTANKCRTMLKMLNLSFGAFDFIKAKDGQLYFLEVNPNGQWVWIEKETGLPISDAIINYLCST